MLETGTVVALDGEYAQIEFIRSPQCKHCGACMSAGEPIMHIRVQNTLGLHVGDVAGIKLPEKSFMEAAMLMYVLPLLALIAALLIASQLTSSDIVMMVVGLGSALIVFLLLRLCEPIFKRSKRFSPRMVKIIKPE